MTHVPCPVETGSCLTGLYKYKGYSDVSALFSELRRRLTSKVNFHGVLLSWESISRQGS